MRYIICFICAFFAVSLSAEPKDISSTLKIDIKNPIVIHADRYRQELLSLAALVFLWAFLKTYYIERSRRSYKLTPEDLSLLKIIEVNANMICKKYKQHKNVININDRRE